MSGLCLNSMTHYIIQMGNFFGSFFSICLYFYIFLKSFGHGFGHNCNKVLGVNFQCPCNIFFFLCMFCFVTAFNSALIGLFQCSTTNWPV